MSVSTAPEQMYQPKSMNFVRKMYVGTRIPPVEPHGFSQDSSIKVDERAMDRSRRAMNPENYNPDGTIRKGKSRTTIYIDWRDLYRSFGRRSGQVSMTILQMLLSKRNYHRECTTTYRMGLKSRETGIPPSCCTVWISQRKPLTGRNAL